MAETDFDELTSQVEQQTEQFKQLLDENLSGVDPDKDTLLHEAFHAFSQTCLQACDEALMLQ